MNFFPILLVIHLLLAIALVGVVLLQRSEGGALGMGGGGGGLLTGQAAGNLLTRTTAILAGAFFLTSLGLAILANHQSQAPSPFDQVPVTTPAAAKAEATKAKAPAKTPALPSAPLAR